MFPLILIIIPLFLVLGPAPDGLAHAGLVFVYIVWALPFILWMLQSYVRGIPRDLEEAATVDGASRFQILRTVIAPLLAPGIVVTTPVRVHPAWNEFFFALVLLQTPDQTTLPLRLAQFVGIEGIVRLGPLAGERAARDHPEPPPLRDHPALADARPALRGGQGLVRRHPDAPAQRRPNRERRSMRKLLGLVLCVALAALAAAAAQPQDQAERHEHQRSRPTSGSRRRSRR